MTSRARALLFATTLFMPFAAHAASLCPFTWSRALTAGSTGADVVALQQFLNVSPTSGYFGAQTEAAVVAFQTKNGISPIGSVGRQTRAKLNTLCAAPAPSAGAATPVAAQTATTTVSDQLTVSDPGQPLSLIAPAGAGVNFTTVTLTAGSRDVQLKSMTIERTGFGEDGAFASVQLFDTQGLPLGKPMSFNNNHKVVLNSVYTIPAGTSTTLYLYANMQSGLSGFDGEMPILQIDAIDASSPIAGALPLKSNPQRINNTLVVGGADATLSPFDPSGNTTHYIGDKNIRFSGIRLSAHSQEDISLSNLIWRQNGTASAGDITNMQMVVGTTSYPMILLSDGRSYTPILNPPVVIPKGNTVDIYVQGDLTTTGAGRTVEFDIDDNTDDEGTTGMAYGFAVGVGATGNTGVAGRHSAFITSDGTVGGTTGSPFFSGSIVTISAGGVNYIQNAH